MTVSTKLDQARDVIQRLENSCKGLPGQLPSNVAIRSAARYLCQYSAKEDISSLMDVTCSGSAVVISPELTEQFRVLLDKLDTRAANDEALRKHLAYLPNHIPEDVRNKNILMSAGLLLYGSLGLWLDDLYIPGKRGNGVHFHGEPAWMIFAAMFFASLNLLTVVIDHYDERNNERVYEWAAKITQVLGWSIVIVAVLLDLFVFRKATG